MVYACEGSELQMFHGQPASLSQLSSTLVLLVAPPGVLLAPASILLLPHNVLLLEFLQLPLLLAVLAHGDGWRHRSTTGIEMRVRWRNSTKVVTLRVADVVWVPHIMGRRRRVWEVGAGQLRRRLMRVVWRHAGVLARGVAVGVLACKARAIG